MSDLAHIGSWFDEQLPQLLEQYGVPSAGWAVLSDGEVVDGAHGVLHLGTGVTATPDSIYQIGSITKLWTSTLVMQLVDEGAVELDATVRTYLPELVLGDEEAAAQVTVRQLLNHTAGFEGDIFTDTGVGDDAVEKFVAILGDAPQLFAPGEQFSYNNTAYSILGRIVEVLRGTTYDQALRERLITPLGLTHAAPSIYEAIMHRVAMGHVPAGPDGELAPAPFWAMARSNSPAGSVLSTSARDLVAFARMHLEDGVAPDGTRVLASGTSERMRAREVDLPDLGLMGTSWGLGFERYDTPDGLLVGHDGNTVGQGAFLRMVPDAGVAFALLTNGGDIMSLFHDVATQVLDGLTDVHLPALPAPPAERSPVDARRFVGTYSADVFDLTVSQDPDGRVWIEQVPKGALIDMGGQVERSELVAYRDDMLIPLEPDRGMHMPHAFLGDDGHGRALYLHLGRAVRRAGA